jgi:hypothetical protein
MAAIITGGNGADTLSGTAAHEIIDGGQGDDWLAGGAGNDTLIGGDGSDTFVIGWNGEGLDLLADFDPSLDRIRILGAPDQAQARLWSSERGGGGIFMELGSSGLVLPGLDFDALFQNADRIEGATLTIGAPETFPFFWNARPIDMDAVEGEAFTFEITRGGATESLPALTAFWAVLPQGWPAPTDIEDFGGWPSGRVEFAAGQTSAQVSFSALRDALTESDETVVVGLWFPGAGWGGPIQLTVEGVLRNDDAASTPPSGAWNEGAAFAALFDAEDYMAANPDVRDAGVDPLAHYLAQGWREGRDPSRAFDGDRYLAAYEDVARSGLNPLQHYLSHGMAEGRQSFAAVGMGRVEGFDRLYYIESNPDVAAAGIDPQRHFEHPGWREGRDPNAWFDTKGYLAANADVAAAGIDPWDHYLTWGWREGRDPSREFDTDAYLAANPDVAAAGANPLLHYLQYGEAEGREVVRDLAWS